MESILTILVKENRTTTTYNSLFIISVHTFEYISMHEQVDKT